MESHKSIPSVCIVGRPNVGKSSLFNQLMGERKAVVVKQPGTTRDRIEAVVKIGKYGFKIVDTGGFLAKDKDALSMEIKEQIYRAAGEASLFVMVTDAIEGVSPADREVTSILRKFNKPVVLAVNKADNERLRGEAVEFYQLGLGTPLAISCLHRKGIDTLKDGICESATDLLEGQEEAGGYLKIAVVGRPNVGKSSFVNKLLNEERVIVNDKPGTTRDSIDTFFSYNGDDYMLIDTAGIRHKRKIKAAVDVFGVMRSKETIKRADVVVLLLDAADGATKDDIDILDLVDENGKACLILVNKWDLAGGVEDVTMDEYRRQLVYASSRLRQFPISFISAKTGENVMKNFSIIKVLDTNLDLKVSTPFLNKLLKENDPSKVPISRKKRRPNFLYAVQTRCRPVAFTVFVNRPESVLPAHFSFIENMLRDNLPLKGIPIKINVKRSRRKR